MGRHGGDVLEIGVGVHDEAVVDVDNFFPQDNGGAFQRETVERGGNRPLDGVLLRDDTELAAAAVDAIEDLVEGGALDKVGALDAEALREGERRGHFENGEFVYKFGSEEEAKGYCLYPLGCRGPQTKSTCGITMWNNRRSWCVQAGSPCIGCCEANPNDPGDNWVEVNTPFYKRHRDLRIGDWMVQPGTIALTLTGLVAAALVVHGFGMKATGRMDGGADFETIRKWDKDHPENSIGTYDLTDEEKAQACKENSGNLSQKERLYDTIGVRPDLKKNDTEGGQE